MTRPDPEWLDRMYNNRALVPEHAAHFSRWAETSAQASGFGVEWADSANRWRQ